MILKYLKVAYVSYGVFKYCDNSGCINSIDMVNFWLIALTNAHIILTIVFLVLFFLAYIIGVCLLFCGSGDI